MPLGHPKLLIRTNLVRILFLLKDNGWNAVLRLSRDGACDAVSFRLVWLVSLGPILVDAFRRWLDRLFGHSRPIVEVSEARAALKHRH